MAGQLYSIRMEFYENGGGATAQLMWSGPGVPKGTVPQSALYPDSAPIMVTQPLGATVEAGTNYTFNVSASGTNNSYQWRRNAVDIPGATSASLALTPTIVTDGGTYSCIISNSYGFAISADAVLNVTFTDSDNDGMQNSWEIANGFNPNSNTDANLDKDGDGRTNLEESVAGTNPNDPNSFLHPTIAKVQNGWRISWVAQSRKSYGLQYKANMGAPSWTTLQFFPEQTGSRVIEYTDTSANMGRFYRVATPGQ